MAEYHRAKRPAVLVAGGRDPVVDSRGDLSRSDAAETGFPEQRFEQLRSLRCRGRCQSERGPLPAVEPVPVWGHAQLRFPGLSQICLSTGAVFQFPAAEARLCATDLADRAPAVRWPGHGLVVVPLEAALVVVDNGRGHFSAVSQGCGLGRARARFETGRGHVPALDCGLGPEGSGWRQLGAAAAGRGPAGPVAGTAVLARTRADHVLHPRYGRLADPVERGAALRRKSAWHGGGHPGPRSWPGGGRIMPGIFGRRSAVGAGARLRGHFDPGPGHRRWRRRGAGLRHGLVPVAR